VRRGEPGKSYLTLVSVALVMILGLGLPGAPAAAFELFGFRLWGEAPADEETIDPVPYSVTLVVLSDDADLTERIRQASILIAREDLPPSGTVGLVARARDDREGLLAVLYEEARYGGTIDIDIAGRPLEDISVTETLVREGAVAPVRITVDPGPGFVFGSVSVEGHDAPEEAAAVLASVGLVPGAPARSGTVVAAEGALELAWHRRGHPFVTTRDRDLVADHARNVLDVRLRLAPGPVARLGRVEVVGAVDVDPAFLARHAVIPEGSRYHPQILERARIRLARLPALASVAVRTGEVLGPDGSVPVVIQVSERKPRTIGAGVNYASTEGAGVEAFWAHRNVFGQSETLRFEGEVERLTTAGFDDIDARFAVAFTKPGFLHPLLTLDLRTGLLWEDPKPYRRRAWFNEGLLSYEWSEHLTLRAGYGVETSVVDDAFGRDTFTLIGLPLIADYDSRDSELDPTRGLLVRIIAEPVVDLDGRSPFLKADSEVRTYHRLGSRRFVAALRGRAGSIVGSDLRDVPAHRRFYAGGGGSVRGYDYLNIGPRLANGDLTGGLSRLEGSAEMRLRVAENWSVVPFVDVGYVAATNRFGGFDAFQVGVGAGVRYHTAVGPLRLDVAFPLDPHKSDPDFAVYLGIGQAF
jgi:translocation and assembly module TamA